MTTPILSATPPSPPMALLHTNPVSVVAKIASSDIDAIEREARQRAIQRLLARAEISKITRGLRARLSYATYKATHNVAHLPISDLESHVRDDALSTWTPSRNDYNDGPVIQGINVTNPSSVSARKGAMAPPTTIPSSNSRGHQSSPGKRDHGSANAAQSLYASILAPPPAKRARTIHNPGDPPVPAPARMTNGVSRHRKRLSHPEGSRGSQSQKAPGSQPYSSVAEHTRAHTRTRSDVGSSHSLSQFAQSSARRTTAKASLTSSQESPHTDSLAHPATPPRASDGRLHSRTGSHPDGGSASASATDQEAIKLLYFLHESPSPARPSTVRSWDGQDAAAFRTLSGNSDLKTQGRVLFPTASGGSSDMTLAYRLLTRDNSNSSISSSAAMETLASRTLTREPTLVVDPLAGNVDLSPQPDSATCSRNDVDVPPVTKVTPPTPIEPSTATQLLPPPSSPQRNAENSPCTQPLSPPSEPKVHNAAPATPGTYTFNLNDFINVSPSPAGPHRTSAPYKQNLSGIRSGGGRKLFAEEEAEQIAGVEETSRMGDHPNTALGAGIHFTRF
ncbi:hypothetical protein B0F90DRAFT_1667073 [Multifurca ochricompacta]|uniref:Uncharacterized protein n=1 Tax=Multifurca ochricompacta TaxID=376703 RepID=A0AAD4M6C8_9AGAM|nr:hypothetical protein B0F90DRAFT_1667073 [Multifurca ochricompacta]